jgi:hypothetical protein
MLSGIDRIKIINSLMPLIKYGCKFRLVTEDDAEFIYTLRTTHLLSRFLREGTKNVMDQREWIGEYKKRETAGKEFYFICLDQETDLRQGLYRLYNLTDFEFESGSWIYLPKIDISKSILGDIALREIAFNSLNFDRGLLEIQKANKLVIKYTMGFSPELIKEDNKYLYFSVSRDSFNYHKSEILRILGF